MSSNDYQKIRNGYFAMCEEHAKVLNDMRAVTDRLDVAKREVEALQQQSDSLVKRYRELDDACSMVETAYPKLKKEIEG